MISGDAFAFIFHIIYSYFHDRFKYILDINVEINV